MNILLLSMPNSMLAFHKGARFPNLGLASIAGNVSGRHNIALADLVLCKRPLRKYIPRLIKTFSPHIIGLSCYSFQYATAIRIAELAKRLNPAVKIVLGGYHPTLWHENISPADIRWVDFIIRNEGEKTFALLLRALEGNKDFTNISGLSYKTNGQFQHNPAGTILNLEELQFPDRKVRILSGYHAWGIPCDVIETSRGCTFDCHFCTITKMYGRTFRRYRPDRIVADIRNAEATGARAIFIVDDNITLNRGHFEAVCDAIISSGLNHLHYITQAGVRGLSGDKSLVDKMAAAGFKTVFLGIENADRDNLNFLGKDKQVNRERTEQAVAYLRENKIIVLGAAIVGNPDDNEEALWENFHLLKQLKIDGPLFFTPTPLPGTRLREEMQAAGLLVNADDFSWYMGNKPNCRTRHLSPVEINRIILAMNRKFLDFDLLRYNTVRHHYPKYLYKRFLSELRELLVNLLATKLGFRDRDPLKAFLRQEVKRRDRWLLEDLNRDCRCWLCSYARGETTDLSVPASSGSIKKNTSASAK